MRFAEIINEMMWQDTFGAAADARRYPNAWIHFSNVPKLGIHPQRMHHDPPGIYFYPVKWLFGDDASLSQFATEYPYYYIVKLNRGAKIINLGRMKAEDVVSIAQQNGWYPALQALQADPSILASQSNPMEKKLLRKPGGLFYAALDYLANVKGQSWLKMLRGYDGLYDPNFGIISKGEISQMVVFGRQNITVLAQGDNKNNTSKAYAGIMKQVATELGGRFAFKYKVPQIDFANDGRPLHVALDLSRGNIALSFYKDQFWMTDTDRYDTYGGDLAHHTDHIKRIIQRHLVTAEAKGNDFFWNGTTVASALRLIAFGKTNQHVEEDGLHVFLSVNNWGSIYAHLRGIVDHQDQLTIGASIESYAERETDWKAETEKVFDRNTSPQEVAKAILDALADELVNNVPNPAALGKRDEIFGFKFGKRFSELLSNQSSTPPTPE